MDNVCVLTANNAAQEIFEWGDLLWFASGQLNNSSEMTVGRCRLKVGSSNHRHYHPNCEEVLHVLEGRISHSIGDRALEMSVGDSIVIPPNIVHNAHNIGTEDALLLITFSSADRKTVDES
jgi:quercetin dioxygenase-like cupin family protein